MRTTIDTRYENKEKVTLSFTWESDKPKIMEIIINTGNGVIDYYLENEDFDDFIETMKKIIEQSIETEKGK